MVFPFYYLLPTPYYLFHSFDLFLDFIRCSASLGLPVSDGFLRLEEGENIG